MSELRTLIFNAGMALCDLRGFASGGEGYVDRKRALQRASDLRAEAAKIERFVQGEKTYATSRGI